MEKIISEQELINFIINNDPTSYVYTEDNGISFNNLNTLLTHRQRLIDNGIICKNKYLLKISKIEYSDINLILSSKLGENIIILKYESCDLETYYLFKMDNLCSTIIINLKSMIFDSFNSNYYFDNNNILQLLEDKYFLDNEQKIINYILEQDPFAIRYTAEHNINFDSLNSLLFTRKNYFKNSIMNENYFNIYIKKVKDYGETNLNQIKLFGFKEKYILTIPGCISLYKKPIMLCQNINNSWLYNTSMDFVDYVNNLMYD